MVVTANRTCVLLSSEDMITQRIDTHLARAKRATVSVGEHLTAPRALSAPLLAFDPFFPVAMAAHATEYNSRGHQARQGDSRARADMPHYVLAMGSLRVGTVCS